MFAPKIARPQTKTAESPTGKLAPKGLTIAARPVGGSAVDQPHILQRSIGNQAALRHLEQPSRSLAGNHPHGYSEQQTDQAKLTTRGATPGGSWDFSKIPMFPTGCSTPPFVRSSPSAPGPAGVIQPKLVVGDVNDALEHEADRVADQVTRMPDADPIITSAPTQLSNPSAAREEEAAQPFQTKPVALSEGTGRTAPSVVHEMLRDQGQPLDRAVRASVESIFRHDFSAVRVHSDSRAAESANRVGALAYTVGSDIVFGSQGYSPETKAGRSLLAHELTHVVQQGHAPPGARATRTKTSIDEPGNEHVPNGDAAREMRSDPICSVRLRSPASVLQRQASTEEVKRAEDEHRAAQRRVYELLEPDTAWDYLRRGDPSPRNLTPEQKAKDPHVIFNNSVAWIRSRRIALNVLTPLPGQSDSAKEVTLFDPSINYPDVGGSVRNTVDFENQVEAKTDDKRMQLVVKPRLTATRLREILRHEIQHVADVHTDPDVAKQEETEFQAEQPKSNQASAILNATIWNKYETEFRAHWLESITRQGSVVGVREDGTLVEQGGSGGVDKFGSDTGPGGELKVSGHESLKSNPLYVPEATIQLQNEKQTRIARFIMRNYFGMEETFLTSPLFRAKIQSLARPEGLNLVNSLRIERLHRAIHGPATGKSLWLHTVTREEGVADAVKGLDDTDIAFLKDRSSSKPFWDDARKQLNPTFFAWMEGYIVQGKKDISPPVPGKPGSAI